jgi:hypothetical protein
MKKKTITTAGIVIVILAGLLLAANWLVSNVNVVELLKQFHGG